MGGWSVLGVSHFSQGVSHFSQGGGDLSGGGGDGICPGGFPIFHVGLLFFRKWETPLNTGIRSMHGQYASYWNAFLFFHKFKKKTCFTQILTPIF